MTLRTKPFTIPRILFSRLTAEFYVRRFWYLLLPWPIMGVALVVTNHNPQMVVMGMIIALWPTTIPLRSYLITSKAARLFQSEVWVSVEDGWVFFHGSDGGMKLETDRVSGVYPLHDYWVLMIGYVKFAFVPKAAFESEKDETRFLKTFKPT